MTKDLVLQGYHVVVPNCTWIKNAEPIEHPMMGKMPASDVVQVIRYENPTIDHIIDVIRHTAQVPQSTNPECIETDPLKKLMGKLPSSEVSIIARGDKKRIAHLKEHYSLEEDQQGKKYLQIIAGVVPNKILESKEAEEAIQKDSLTYRSIIRSTAAKDEHLIRISLDKKYALPGKDEIEYLLEREVKDCKLFEITCKNEDYRGAAERMKAVYSMLSSPAKIKKVRDVSEKTTKETAMATLAEFGKCMAVNNVASGFGKMIMGIFDHNEKAVAVDHNEEEDQLKH